MPKHGPEWHIQRALREYLRERGWHVETTHGNLFQSGFPDLYITHERMGTRWIDCKVEGAYTFTKAQRLKWPIWNAKGTGIWILTGADQENYDKLFKPPNWEDYWKKSWELPDIDVLLLELDDLEDEIEKHIDYEVL